MAKTLSLSTQLEHPAIEIDGERYPLKTMITLGLLEQKRFQVYQRKLQQLLKISGEEDPDELQELDWDTLSEEDIDQLAQALEDIIPILLPDAPAQKLRNLTDMQRLDIFQVFSEYAKEYQGEKSKPVNQ